MVSKMRKPTHNNKAHHRKKHIIHIRGLPDNLYSELWALRYWIGASSWVEVIAWAIEKYHEELEEE